VSGLSIRPLQPGDFDLLWPLLQQMGKTDSEAAVRQRLDELTHRSEQFLPVARAGDMVAGYAWAQDYGSHLRSGQRVVRLHDLFVVPQQRRRGVGSLLFQSARAWAARQRRATWLQWQAGGEALAFYARLGLRGEECPDPAHPFFEIEP